MDCWRSYGIRNASIVSCCPSSSSWDAGSGGPDPSLCVDMIVAVCLLSKWMVLRNAQELLRSILQGVVCEIVLEDRR